MAYFYPHPNSAHKYKLRIYQDLADSIRHIAYNADQLEPNQINALSACAASIDSSTTYLDPKIFCCYTHLAYACLLQDRDKISNLVSTISLITSSLARNSQKTCLFLDLDEADQLIFEELMGLEEYKLSNNIHSAGNIDFAFDKVHNQALDLMEKFLPDYMFEFKEIVSTIYLLNCSPNDNCPYFDGGSSPMIWGGLFLNSAIKRSVTQHIELLVHEMSHIMLYSLSQYDELVLNSDVSCYSSPLRQDKRPMHGIYHATWVSARMAHSMHLLASNSNVEFEIMCESLSRKKENIDNYQQGRDILEQYGQLTELAAEIIESSDKAISEIL